MLVYGGVNDGIDIGVDDADLDFGKGVASCYRCYCCGLDVGI